jgi:hypothetical protein
MSIETVHTPPRTTTIALLLWAAVVYGCYLLGYVG